jgi:uroporphyrinogen decarboxylase
MTPRERFVNWMNFKPVDRAPMMDLCGVWPQTRLRWLREGMPESVNTNFFTASDPYFGLESIRDVGINTTGPDPELEAKTIEEDETSVVFTDAFGRTRRGLKENGKYTSICMDTYIDFPVKDRASWEKYRFRYEGSIEKRYPASWEQFKAEAKTSTVPLMCSYPFGYYSMLRNWIGTERLSFLWYDDPGLIHECLEFLTDFAIRVMTPALKAVQFDFVYIHEDLAGKGGPLIGPSLFREFLSPHYRRYTDFLKKHGVGIIIVDTDGDHRALTRTFLDAGVTALHPLERAAGMDPIVMRKEYGKEVAITGAIDKREIAKGPAAIDAELARSVAPILAEGGYIPMTDHSVPPDISLKNFQYYLKAKRRLLEGR